MFILPDHEVCELLLRLDSDTNTSINLFPVFRRRPILDAHHADEVEGPGHHHDAARLLLPGHPPEVGHGRLGGTLGHDVGFGLHQALKQN